MITPHWKKHGIMSDRRCKNCNSKADTDLCATCQNRICCNRCRRFLPPEFFTYDTSCCEVCIWFLLQLKYNAFVYVFCFPNWVYFTLYACCHCSQYVITQRRYALNGIVEEVDLDVSVNNHSYEDLINHLRVDIERLIDQHITEHEWVTWQVFIKAYSTVQPTLFRIKIYWNEYATNNIQVHVNFLMNLSYFVTNIIYSSLFHHIGSTIRYNTKKQKHRQIRAWTEQCHKRRK